MLTKRAVILIALAALAAVIFVLNQLANDLYLYWVYWWYDVMMHFLGGFLIGGLAAWAVCRRGVEMAPCRMFTVVGVTSVVVGVGWEVFEYLTGAYIGQTNVVLDTTTDLVLDVAGALLAGWSVRALFFPSLAKDA